MTEHITYTLGLPGEVASWRAPVADVITADTLRKVVLEMEAAGWGDPNGYVLYASLDQVTDEARELAPSLGIVIQEHRAPTSVTAALLMGGVD